MRLLLPALAGMSALLAALLCCPAASQTYRCTGSDGRVSYGDQPCKGSVETTPRVPSAPTSATGPAGERALALARAEFERADKPAAIAALQAIYSQLSLPTAGSGPYGELSSANFEKAPNYEERDELSHTILVVRGAAKVGFMRNAVLIADGDVDIAHVARSIVVARGSIRISHETPVLAAGQDPGGLYLAKGSIEFSHCRRPTLYAVHGAIAPCSGTAINTDVKRGSTTYIGAISKMGVPPMFVGEPDRRAPRGSSAAGTSDTVMVVNAGESMPYSGIRCPDAPDEVSLHTAMLPAARRYANCPRIDSAAVSCETGTRGEALEKWTFQLCGKTIALYSSDGIGRASSVRPRQSDSTGADHRSITIRSAEQVERERSLVGCKKIVTRGVGGKDGRPAGIAQVCADNE